MAEPSQLDQLLRSPESTEGPLPVATFARLAAELDYALSQGTAEELKNLERQLSALVKVRLSRLPAEARREVVGDEHGSHGAAFEAGRLAFAQLLASQISARRAPDRFLGQLRKKAFAGYVHVLREGPKTNVELMEALKEADATVSRKLRLLRAAGITAFRKEGRNVINFLTPAGMAASGGPAQVVASAEPTAVEADRALWRINTAPLRNPSTQNRPPPRFQGHPTADRAPVLRNSRAR